MQRPAKAAIRAAAQLEQWQAHAAMSIRAGISHMFLGDEAMEHLGLPKSTSHYALWGVVPFIYTLDRARSFIPGATRLTARLGGAWQDWHSQQLLDKSAPH